MTRGYQKTDNKKPLLAEGLLKNYLFKFEPLPVSGRFLANT